MIPVLSVANAGQWQLEDFVRLGRCQPDDVRGAVVGALELTEPAGKDFWAREIGCLEDFWLAALDHGRRAQPLCDHGGRRQSSRLGYELMAARYLATAVLTPAVRSGPRRIVGIPAYPRSCFPFPWPSLVCDCARDRQPDNRLQEWASMHRSTPPSVND